MLTIEPARSGAAQASMRVLNSDGSEAQMCGNGLRCVVKYLHDGSAATLEEIWTVNSTNDEHGMVSDFTKIELNDLVEYLRTLGPPEEVVSPEFRVLKGDFLRMLPEPDLAGALYVRPAACFNVPALDVDYSHVAGRHDASLVDAECEFLLCIAPVVRLDDHRVVLELEDVFIEVEDIAPVDQLQETC